MLRQRRNVRRRLEMSSNNPAIQEHRIELTIFPFLGLQSLLTAVSVALVLGFAVCTSLSFALPDFPLDWSTSLVGLLGSVGVAGSVLLYGRSASRG